jgi:hypothetical protein
VNRSEEEWGSFPGGKAAGAWGWKLFSFQWSRPQSAPVSLDSVNLQLHFLLVPSCHRQGLCAFLKSWQFIMNICYRKTLRYCNWHISLSSNEYTYRNRTYVTRGVGAINGKPLKLYPNFHVSSEEMRFGKPSSDENIITCFVWENRGCAHIKQLQTTSQQYRGRGGNSCVTFIN